MAGQMTEVIPKESHVTFAPEDDHGSISGGKEASQGSSLVTDDPATPPTTGNDLPTPPNSTINMASTTRPSSTQSNLQHIQLASTSHINTHDTDNSLPSSSNQSPSMQVHQRRAKRISAGSSSMVDEIASTSQQPVTERQSVLAEAQKGRERGRPSRREHNGTGSESSRSRTPSPILGSVTDSSGHLSFAASLMPSAEEVRNLLYGPDEGKDAVGDDARPTEVTKDELQGLLERLSTMGFDRVDEKPESTDTSREKELASMVKKLVAHTRHQEAYLDSLDQTLHDTRIRSISLLTSLRTTFAHTLASEYSLRARVEAELEGARSQAKKLSVMLAKSESRNEEIDRERAMSAEEEVLWQEEMKDHASAYAQQQAARARATQMAQLQAQGQKLPAPDAVKVEPVNDEIEVAADSNPPASIRTPANGNPNGLDEPFVEKKADEGAVTGLGISAGPNEPAFSVAAMNASPLSTLVKERNKLLSDKRYLKSRVRDTEAQRDRLEAELKALRPLLVIGPASKTAAAANVVAAAAVTGTPNPSTPGRSHKRDRSRRRRQATMGDAQAEHLLLAARRLKELNELKEGEEDGRPKTPPPSGVASSVQPRTPKTPRTGTTTTPRSMASREMLDTVTQSGASSRAMPNGSPLAAKAANSANQLGRWGAHERVDSAMSGSGIEDLLQAAQTVITPEKKSAHRQSHTRSKSGPNLPGSGGEEEEDGDFTVSQNRNLLSGVAFSSKDIVRLNESPKRRRVSSAALDGSRSGLALSPDKRGAIFQSGRRARTSTEGAEPFMSQSSAGLSALDLLADQAAASQHPSQSSDPSGSGEGEANIDLADEVYGSEEDEGMMVDDPDETTRPIAEGGIGSHYYPRGAYGHSYAQQPLAMGHEGYRMAPQPGYTYSPNSSGPHSQSWSSQNSMTAPRNGIYAPRGVSPPPGASRYAAAYHNGPRLSTGNIAPQYIPTHNHSNSNSQSNSPDDFASSHHSNNRASQKGGNTSPDKRLPYVRWSDEEDQKLRKAISEYGQRWESVAGVVGTRSYHQCRQRYLLMRRKEAAARDGTSNDDARSATSVTAS